MCFWFSWGNISFVYVWQMIMVRRLFVDAFIVVSDQIMKLWSYLLISIKANKACEPVNWILCLWFSDERDSLGPPFRCCKLHIIILSHSALLFWLNSTKVSCMLIFNLPLFQKYYSLTHANRKFLRNWQKYVVSFILGQWPYKSYILSDKLLL